MVQAAASVQHANVIHVNARLRAKRALRMQGRLAGGGASASSTVKDSSKSRSQAQQGTLYMSPVHSSALRGSAVHQLLKQPSASERVASLRRAQSANGGMLLAGTSLRSLERSSTSVLPAQLNSDQFGDGGVRVSAYRPHSAGHRGAGIVSSHVREQLREQLRRQLQEQPSLMVSSTSRRTIGRNTLSDPGAVSPSTSASLTGRVAWASAQKEQATALRSSRSFMGELIQAASRPASQDAFKSGSAAPPNESSGRAGGPWPSSAQQPNSPRTAGSGVENGIPASSGATGARDVLRTDGAARRKRSKTPSKSRSKPREDTACSSPALVYSAARPGTPAPGTLSAMLERKLTPSAIDLPKDGTAGADARPSASLTSLLAPADTRLGMSDRRLLLLREVQDDVLKDHTNGRGAGGGGKTKGGDSNAAAGARDTGKRAQKHVGVDAATGEQTAPVVRRHTTRGKHVRAEAADAKHCAPSAVEAKACGDALPANGSWALQRECHLLTDILGLDQDWLRELQTC